MKTIHILDTGCERYTIKSDCSCLGRQWDNIAEELQIVIPEREKENVCTMIVSADGVVVDHLDIKDEPKEITNALSRFSTIEISFTFTNESGYVKNSEIRTFYFAEARKPEDFVPVEPEQSSKIDFLLGNGFTRARLEENILSFYNSNGDKVQEFTLPAGGGTGGGVVEEFVNNKVSEGVQQAKNYTDTKVANLVGSAPETLNTLEELAKAISNNPNIIQAINDSISTKQNANDSSLQTNSKNIVGAINEINFKFGNTIAQIDDILGV